MLILHISPKEAQFEPILATMSTTTTTATASASASTSGIELHPLPANISQKPSPFTSTSQSADDTTDPILQASREADSTVPEGGYGWVVVGGCFVVAWWIIGTSYSWGVIQGALIEDGLGTPAVLSFVGSLAAALISALAIVNSRVMRRIGPRKTGLLGISLLGISELLSSFAVKNVGAMFATSGVIMGLGMRYVVPS